MILCVFVDSPERFLDFGCDLQLLLLTDLSPTSITYSTVQRSHTHTTIPKRNEPTRSRSRYPKSCLPKGRHARELLDTLVLELIRSLTALPAGSFKIVVLPGDGIGKLENLSLSAYRSRLINRIRNPQAPRSPMKPSVSSRPSPRGPTSSSTSSLTISEEPGSTTMECLFPIPRWTLARVPMLSCSVSRVAGLESSSPSTATTLTHVYDEPCRCRRRT